MKFAAFERTVEFLYKHVVPTPRDQMSKQAQLVVTFSGGYIAGVFCALVSHPADTVVSKLNSEAGSTAIQAARDLGMKGIQRANPVMYPCRNKPVPLTKAYRFLEGPFCTVYN